MYIRKMGNEYFADNMIIYIREKAQKI